VNQGIAVEMDRERTAIESRCLCVGELANEDQQKHWQDADATLRFHAGTFHWNGLRNEARPSPGG
jgi:hypothetical protein